MLRWTVLGAGALLLFAVNAGAAAPGQALVIGNAGYASSPAPSNCVAASRAVAGALAPLGFNVIAREDASSGGFDAAVGEFAKRLAEAPDAPAFVYVCGRAVVFNDRPFLLPTSAVIGRPSDVLTQGTLAKTLFDVVTRGGPRAAVVALDIARQGDAPAPVGFDALTLAQTAPGLGAVVASAMPAGAAGTPLSGALVAGLAGPAVQTATLLDAVAQQVPAAATLAVRLPVTSGYLAGAPPVPAPLATPAPPPPPPALAAPAAPAAVAAPPVAALPDEAQMTEVDRRQVQEALLRFGYYDGKVDGVFGAETRAAMRRYQHELGADMTGRLTAAQASRLVSSH
jgi:hypothetical protein